MNDQKTLSEAISIGLLSYALTFILQNTEGPFSIFRKLRGMIGVTQLPVTSSDEDGTEIVEGFVEVVPLQSPELAKLFMCPWCLSTWVVGIYVTLFHWNVSLGEKLKIWLGAVGVSGLITEITDNGSL